MQKEKPAALKMRSISGDLVAGLMIIVVAAAGLVMLVNYMLAANKAGRALKHEANQYLSYLSQSLELSMWSLDEGDIRRIAEAFMTAEQVAVLEITDNVDQTPIYSKRKRDGDDVVMRQGAILHDDQVIGTVLLGLSKVPYREDLRRHLYSSILITAVITIVMMGAAGLLMRLFVRNPLRLLMDGISKLSHGDYDYQFENVRHREIAVIHDQFNTMAERVKGREASLTDANQRLKEEVKERKKAEQAFRESDKRYRLLFENASDAIFFHGIAEDGLPTNFLDANRVACERYGYSKSELLRMGEAQLDAPDFVPNKNSNAENFIADKRALFEMTHVAKDGTRIPVEISLNGFDQDGKSFAISIVRDITERKQSERRLVQAQKMEAIGALAGGIAHDFNNILAPIMGYAELLMEGVAVGSGPYEHAKRIFTAANRAGELVRQILTFSRSSAAEKKPIKLQHILKEVLKLTQSTMPATIEVHPIIDPGCGLIMADPTQIHQVAMNLITNAYHAMLESGGKLNITLESTVLGPGDLSGLSIVPGEYVCLAVEDTGQGMDAQTLSQIFNPYFTTKEKEKGTGLGLSVVHGIVKELGGEIKVYSELGKGSVFKTYFPVISDEGDLLPLPVEETFYHGREHILLVDDEEMIVEMEKAMLEKMGYQVTDHTSSVEALKAFQGVPDQYDLVVTDMTMPQMTGLQLLQELKKKRRDIKVILCTGFSEHLSEETADQFDIDGFLMKPVIMSKLSKLVRSVLDR